MNTLREALHDYLSLRRTLGFKLQRVGRPLTQFVSFVEQQESSYITVSLALQWAQQPSSSQPSTWAQRLSFVRGFARYRSSTDSRTEIPAYSLLPHKPRRARPYLYTDEEIQQLLQAALALEPATDFKRRTYYCLLGLLSVSGMRVSEGTNLRVKNVDLTAGILRLEGTKFGKSRLVPLHTSTQTILSDYKLLRDEFLNGTEAEYFFINRAGKRLDEGSVRKTFYRLSRQIGIRRVDSSHGPRLQDFRHLFAVKTLQNWYRNGEDVERRLPILSTYLGHVHVNDTYWYLTAYPELMGAAVSRLEHHWEAKP